MHWHYHCFDWRFYDPLMAGSIDGTDTDPHDHGIVRAMNAHYRPNKKVKSKKYNTIFVAHLNDTISESDMRRYFKQFGHVESVRHVRDIVTGFSRRYGFVEFSERRYVDRVLNKSPHEINGQKVIVERELERILRGWKPRRLGGGLGGSKESGQLRFGGVSRPFRKPFTLKEDVKNRIRALEQISKYDHK